MNIEDFLPKYPNIEIDNNFNKSIFTKKEFYDEKLEKNEEIPKEKGVLMKNQKIISRYLSSNTIYNGVLLIHEMGTGKTCATIGAIEKIKNETTKFKRAYIFAKGKNILNNFIKELKTKCTDGRYDLENNPNEYKNFYNFKYRNKITTYQTFAKQLEKVKKVDIKKHFSNCILVFDEIHNIKIQDEKNNKDSRINVYKNFHNFLHSLENTKVILLSGTPIINSPDEISSVMNLILPLNKQLSVGSEFIKEYLQREKDDNNNLYNIKQNKKNKLKEYFKGRVSFLKSIKSNVKKIYVGEKKYKNNKKSLDNFVIKPLVMSNLQKKVYLEAYKKDKEKNKEKEFGYMDIQNLSSIYTNSKQSSLFVFPDETYGSLGFSKNFTKTKKPNTIRYSQKNGDKKEPELFSYSLRESVKKYIKQDGNNDNNKLNKLKDLSIKFYYIINEILKDKDDKKCFFIYSEYVEGSGAILFSEILKLFGFSEAEGKETKHKKRFGLLTSKTSTTKKMQEVVSRFNREDNKNGEFIKVLIGTKIISEGLSFNHIQEEFILTPWFNYSVIEQAIARGIRLGSHDDLIKGGETDIEVNIHQLVSVTGDDNEESVDFTLYKMSEDKDKTFKRIIRVIMEASFDCALNYKRNKYDNETYKNTRECEYQDCDYICDNFKNKKEYLNDIDNKKLDFSTYNLYYTETENNEIIKSLDVMLKNNNKINKEEIIKVFSEEYEPVYIEKILDNINKEDEFISRKDYIKKYYTSPIKKIILEIEKIFKYRFNVNISEIYENKNIKKYSKFQILSVLKKIIEENVSIKNSYGILNYLREKNNTYFLVDNITNDNNLFLEYYSKYPALKPDIDFSNILRETELLILPNFIKTMCSIKDEKHYQEFINNIPEDIQEIFIELTISELYKKDTDILKKLFENFKKTISELNILKKFILSNFSSYINIIKDASNNYICISSRLKNKKIIKCFYDGNWSLCSEKSILLLQQHINNREEQLLKSDNNYYGKINNEKNIFSLVNLKDNKNLQGEDNRKISSGKNCSSWKKEDLIHIIITDLKILPQNISKYKKTDPKFIKFLKKYENNYTVEDNKLDYLYYYFPKNKYDLCEIIKKHFIDNNLIVYDSQTGTKGGHKKSQQVQKTEVYKITKLTESKFNKFQTEINTLMRKCFENISNDYEFDTNYTWYGAFNNNKIIGFLAIDNKNNSIWNVCVSEEYRGKGILGMILEKVKKKCKINFSLYVDKSQPKEKQDRLVKIYERYGFTTVDLNEYNEEEKRLNAIKMVYKCS